MEGMLPGLFVILLAATVLIVARRMTQSSVEELVGASFVGQRAVIDGKEVRSDDLKILYRWPAMAKRDGLGGFSMLDARWLCRAPDGSYLLAIATNSNKKDEGGVHWSWSLLTEERAQASLLYKRKAYRAVFGELPPSAS
ncbi:hypothetical protein [Dyella psychrodurans]|uniref:Uncharacterized protein n=1 Tax=Dyella psychrodurans TaxID=1927960 RepID=A0A370WUJ8_9GAMM|nr:hypothetical protein [Dyella psychrodurans]RDS79792.1 hypothetical protein DWU99_20560 [Dyella psychrodurans]